MVATIILAFFLSLFLRASFSLPIAQDVKIEDSETVFTENTVLDVETILHNEDKNKLVQSLTTENVFNSFESIEVEHGKRFRRDIIVPKAHCPGDRIPYGNQCLTKEQFEEYNDVSEGSDDYKEER